RLSRNAGGHRQFALRCIQRGQSAQQKSFLIFGLLVLFAQVADLLLHQIEFGNDHSVFRQPVRAIRNRQQPNNRKAKNDVQDVMWDVNFSEGGFSSGGKYKGIKTLVLFHSESTPRLDRSKRPAASLGSRTALGQNFQRAVSNELD